MSELLRTTGERLGLSLEQLLEGDIGDTDWHRANLSGRTLTGISFEGVSMRNVVCNGAEGSSVSFAAANCILGAFRGAVFIDSSFRGARLKYADFAGAVLQNVDFEGADLTEASFVGARLTGSTFASAAAQGADFSGCTLSAEQRNELGIEPLVDAKQR